MDGLIIDKLRLDRWFAHHGFNRRTPPPEDYVSWAVDLLVAGRDTPSLRILAGLNPTHDRGDIDGYFLRSCKELGLGPLELIDNLRDAVPLIRRLYRSGTLSPEETVHCMARLYEISEYSDPLLCAWFHLDDYLPVDDYFPNEWKPLEKKIEREWELYDRALTLDLPGGFDRFVRCEKCQHIGLPRPSFSARHAIRKRAIPADAVPLQHGRCARCGSSDVVGMASAEVREDYFSRVERSQ